MRQHSSIFKINSIGVLAACLCLLASCVQFKTAQLYDGDEPTPPLTKPDDLSLIVEPTIYSDDHTDVWGLEEDVCKNISVTTDVVYSGTEAIQATWNRYAKGCKWAGIGIGWDGYAGKDLTEIMDFAAIQFYVRSKEGKMFGLPIVLTLEDYSGGMGFAYTGNKYFERTGIDEEWQKVAVPLSAFDVEVENLDPSNIKQLMLELQQSGSIYIDDIKLVFYEEPPQDIYLSEQKVPDAPALPVQIFDDAFINNNGWGMLEDDCQHVRLVNDTYAGGQKAIKVDWNAKEGCKLVSFGASWNGWHPTDITDIKENAAIQFAVKSKGKIEDIKVGFEDYDRVRLHASADAGPMLADGWQSVTVPLSRIPAGLDLTRIKHMYFKFENKGSAVIDDIRIINLQ